MLHQPPSAFGRPTSRWTLDQIRAVCDWLRVTSRGAMAALLDRLGLSWQQGRRARTSPDPDYLAKLAGIAVDLRAGRSADRQQVVVYFDAMAFTAQPTLAGAWAARRQPLEVPPRTRSAPVHRVLGALDVRDGRVVVQRVGERVGVAELVGFWQALRAAYPAATTITVILDNLPLHFHPDGLVALQPQTLPFPIATPGNWPPEASAAARRRWGHLRLPIRLVQVPTYAPWTNPIERLWRFLRQTVLHLHRHADDEPTLLARVDGFFAQFATGSSALLQYCGLLHPK